MDVSAERSRLSRDVFIALAAVAWADGSVDPDEADAIVRVALDEGLDLDTIAEIEEATASPVSLTELPRESLNREERLFVYAVAKWIARMDGVITREEGETLTRLAELLGIPDRVRAQVEAIVQDVAEMPEGDRPSRYDLGKLRELIGERLIGRKSAAPATRL